ncbi:MAG TPA: phosphotransferase [Polyangiaceae bacterium]|nr:phosphotransferase [Polyangiaceae bacterium]
MASDRLSRLVEAAVPGAQIVRVTALGADEAPHEETTKGGGYGAPLRIDVTVEGRPRALVFRTVTANQFGHDRRADRAAEVLLAADTFGELPRHVRALDVGAFRGTDDFVSLDGTGEFYLLTTHAEGTLYADDLRRIARHGAVEPRDLERHGALLDYLAELHLRPVPPNPVAYVRSIRDTVGSGEGLFGIVDAYPDGVPGAPRERLERIELECVRWRGRLRGRHERLARIHGDFHPFNLLFDGRAELALLDTSRGSLGDPADDVACLAVNFPFFALGYPGAWRSALRSLWLEHWDGYERRTGDAALREVVAPFLAWRGLVLASPIWYPELVPADRERILGFVEAALRGSRFSPGLADEFFDT